MKLCLIASLLLLTFASSTFADEAPKTTTVGGGVTNPWRSPYRTALTDLSTPLAIPNF